MTGYKNYRPVHKHMAEETAFPERVSAWDAETLKGGHVAVFTSPFIAAWLHGRAAQA